MELLHQDINRYFTFSILSLYLIHIDRHHGHFESSRPFRSLLRKGPRRSHHRWRQWYALRPQTHSRKQSLLTLHIGIGLAYATAIAKSGASKVYLLSRRLEPLEAAAEAIDPSIVKPIQCDVTSPESIAAAVKKIEAETSHIDVLINNAGILGPNHSQVEKTNSIAELQKTLLNDWSKWDLTWQTNTSAVISVSASFLHLLDAGNKRRGWVEGRRDQQKRAEGADYDESDTRTSQIITVASIAAFNREVTAGLAYTASKAGAVMLGKSMAYFLAPWGIRSNIICPGRKLYPGYSCASQPATTNTNHKASHPI